MATLGGQPILILKEGSSRARGNEALLRNIEAASLIAELVKSSLGPKGMDKMLVDGFGDITITNDGAVILDEIDVQHPAAKMMVEVAKTQDDEVGDGTTSAVILAGELLLKAQELIRSGVHPIIVIEGYQKASQKALEVLEHSTIRVQPLDKETLKKIAATAISGKVISEASDLLVTLAVDAVLHVAENTETGYSVDVEDVKVQKKTGESLGQTQLIRGVIIDKEVVHSGMPKRIKGARIALLDCPLEIEKTEFTAKINIENPDEMQAFLDEEEKMIRAMVSTVTDSGATVLVCQKGIDDLAQHFLAKNGILAIRRVKKSDMKKLTMATGAKVINNREMLTSEDLGNAELVEERKLGVDKWVFVEGCKNPKAVTILIRGGTERLVDEAERSLHDALMVIKDVVEEPKIVVGGGAAEMEIAGNLRGWAQTLSGREQLAAKGFADAMERIPITLAENAGLDPIDSLVQLRAEHEKGQTTVGVNVLEGEVGDLRPLDVVEPYVVKRQMLKSASEAASMILKVDDMIAAAKMKDTGPPMGPEGAGEY
jgi:thermosome